MQDRTGWTRGATGPQRIGNKRYKTLVEFSRPCATCNQPFSIFVTERIAEGLADSNNFGLRNCEQHRRSGPGAVPEELEALRTKDKTMADELAGLHAAVRRLTQENADLKAQLAARNGAFPWK